jgi:DNA-binding transcriptional LysR family regulator
MAIAQHWVVPSLPHLVSQHPRLDLDLLVDDDFVDLARDGVDLAIRTGTPTALSMVARPLGHIDTGLYANPAYLARHGTPQRVDDLVGHLLLSNCGHPVLNRLNFGGGRHVAAGGRLRSGSTAVLAQMAAMGLGIAHLPIRMAEAPALATMLQPVLTKQFESAKVPVCVLMLPDRQRLPRMRTCVEHLVTLFDQHGAAAAARCAPRAQQLL